ncbi:isocitrate/isopropylmalate dehydrogenase family protein [Streptomyces mobaraensis]|uniref:3-isopropylmalate dehydrogenase n=1 Tax=Streptomyces mobaraensis TaxID=35621 RepID=A0A5N5WB65_STRMB|nr:isocitrate/isopropylmalate family dehydrogenase [Streptomyces mobaraensis]KAB7846932.1 3-isopropylmalate dehydrogenase [Streptomyces mobaraensis]
MTPTTPPTVLVLPGEGIGPEVVRVGRAVLEHVLDRAGLPATISEHAVGRPAYERTGQWLPDPVRDALDQAAAEPRGAVLFGATADEPIGELRSRYDLYANLRPARPLPALHAVSPLRPERLEGVDVLIVRELVSDVYYGRRRTGTDAGRRWAGQEMYYREDEVRRIVRCGLGHAEARRRHLTLVHKANAIPDVFGLWLDVLAEERAAYPHVDVQDRYADTMAMELVLRPADFDVIVTGNLFGDLLSEITGAVLGSLGLMPSASLSPTGFALYEPVGGTAPDIAGTGRANPLGTIGSVELMLRHTFGAPRWADRLAAAVALAVGLWRTPDIAGPGDKTCTTEEMGAAVCDAFDAVATEEATE